MSSGLSDPVIRVMSVAGGLVIAVVFGVFGHDLGATLPVSVVGGAVVGAGTFLTLGAVLQAETAGGSLAGEITVLELALHRLAAGSALTFAGTVLLVAGALVVPETPVLGLVAAVVVGGLEYAVLSRVLATV